MASAQSHYTFSPELREAYEEVMSLKLDEAEKTIAAIKKDDPENLLVYFVEDYIDFFEIFIKEEKETFDALLPQKDVRIDELRSGPEDSPYHLFSRAEVHLHWAAARLKFNDKWEAAREIYKAYRLLKKNEKKFPAFVENKKSLSIIHSLAASIPSWIRTVIGIEGSVSLGTQEIEELIDYCRVNDNIFYKEAVGIYSYILYYLTHEPEKAYRLLEKAELDPKENPLACFLLAVMAHNTGRNDVAIHLLENRPTGDAYLEFNYLELLLGKYKLYRLDDDASRYIENFLTDFKGRHFIKEAYQKLAWYEWIVKDNAAGYHENMQLCKHKGHSLIDEDKTAMHESEDDVLPDKRLLKARLLFDGGYNEEAYRLLKAHVYDESHPDHITYLYRLGRVEQELGLSMAALQSFRSVLALDHTSYMACNAALQCGYIYEEQSDLDNAKYFYNLCLDIKPENYKESLHQKAKSGLHRIE